MKVCIIASDEPRNRQRFITKPLLQLGHDVNVLKTSPLYCLVFRLAALMFSNRPDVIIFISVGFKELFAYALVNKFDVPFIVRLGGDRLRDLNSVVETLWDQGNYLSWAKFRTEKFIVKYLLKKTSFVILVNEALKPRISTQLNSANKAFIVPQFSDAPPFLRDYIYKTPLNILTVTNFTFSDKADGVIWLAYRLNKFADLNKTPIEFNIAGTGLHFHDLEQSLEGLVQSKFLTLKLLGFVKDLDFYYKSADVFVYRSFHDATPNVIIESKRFSLPLLANDCDEFRNLISHRISGVLYQDEDHFNELLNELIDNKAFRTRIGTCAHQDYQSSYSIDTAKKNIQAALSEVVKKGKI